MAKFPRRGGSGNGRNYVVFGLCCVLVLFAVSSRSSWLKPSKDQTVPHVEGRSLRAASTASSFSLFSAATTESLGTDAQGDDVLVMYLYDNRDPVWIENFKFFIQWGIAANDGCSYIILVNEAMYAAKDTLPGYATLPSNAEYAQADTQSCALGLGMLSQALNTTTAKSHTFKHYIFMNSYVRGPFLPNYLMGSMHWSRLFTRMITAEVKLVGPTITCSNPPTVSVNNTMPYVQFNALATDKIGLDVIHKNGSVLTCHSAPWEDEYYSQLGASRAILNAGYNLDSFMLRYRGVDWTEPRNWGCNAKLNPVGEFFYDGTTISPFEVVFVAMNTLVVENNWSFARQSSIYQEWLRLQDLDSLDVNVNSWTSNPWPIKHQRIAYMQSRGPGCFDHRYYLQKNPDLKVLKTVLELWEHFVMLGQFEGRSYRWSCDDDRKLPF